MIKPKKKPRHYWEENIQKIIGKLPKEDEICHLWKTGKYSFFKIACQLNIPITDVIKALAKHRYFIPCKEFLEPITQPNQQSK